MRTRSSSTKGSLVAVMCCGLGKIRDSSHVWSSDKPAEFPACSLDVAPMRLEDVAATAAVLRNSLREMIFMAMMIIAASGAELTHRSPFRVFRKTGPL